MALTITLATAVAAISATAAIERGFTLSVYALTLLAAAVLTARRPDRRLPFAGREVRLLVWLTGAGFLAFYLAGWTGTPDGHRTIASYAVLAIVVLSQLWPSAPVVRYCLLLAAGSVALAGTALDETAWPLAGVTAGAAVALVALNRRSPGATPSGTRPAPAAAPRPRRIASEAGALFAIAGGAALLVASLLPPPAGGNRASSGAGEGRSSPAPRYLGGTDTLDAGGSGSGAGEEVVFRVTTTTAALWRTLTFDRYDGRTWHRSHAFAPSLREPRPPAIGAAFAPGSFTLTQRIEVRAGSVSVLPAAARAAAVDLEDGTAVFAPDASVFPAPTLARGDAYVVESVVTPAAAAGTGPGAGPDATPPADVAAAYLGFPPVPGRVTELATGIAAGAATPFQRAEAVQAWVVGNTEVKAGTAELAPGADPIDRFLFVDRGGSPEQAASAMAVMLRSLGIPARLAVGYLPGDRAALGGDFVVRARHAHAWVEAWLPGTGWVSFDPAGRFPGATPDGDSLLDRLARLFGAARWLLLAALAAAVGWGAWRVITGRRRRRSRPWATRCYERLNRAGRRRGRPRRPDETPAEYCRALAADVADQRLAEVGELLTAAAYSRRQPPPEARQWADAVVRDVERRPRASREPAAAGRGRPRG